MNITSTDLLLGIYEQLFKHASKKYGTEFDETSKKIQDEIFEYYKKNHLENVHLTLISGFGSLLGTGYQNKNYEKQHKKEDTIPLYIQNYGFGTITYFNSITYSLRSKKNNRPIHFNFGKVNGAFIGQLQKFLNFWKSSAPYGSKVGMLTKTIMPVVFIGKDEELHNQEKLLSNIYSLYKNRYFRISIKGFYSQKETLLGLLKLYTSDELQQSCEKSSVKKEVQNLLVEKSNHLRDFNIFIDGKEELLIIEAYLKSLGLEYELDDQFNIYSPYFDEYLHNYIFYEETLSKIIKTRSYGLKNLYENNAFDADQNFYAQLLKKIYEGDQKNGKLLYKKIYEIECRYRECVVNSFLTQPDLSNSLELVQDVFQGFLRGLSIDFDDKFITEIDSKMLRFSKEDKKQTIFKNINYFNLTKLK